MYCVEYIHAQTINHVAKIDVRKGTVSKCQRLFPINLRKTVNYIEYDRSVSCHEMCLVRLLGSWRTHYHIIHWYFYMFVSFAVAINVLFVGRWDGHWTSMNLVVTYYTHMY